MINHTSPSTSTRCFPRASLSCQRISCSSPPVRSTNSRRGLRSWDGGGGRVLRVKFVRATLADGGRMIRGGSLIHEHVIHGHDEQEGRHAHHETSAHQRHFRGCGVRVSLEALASALARLGLGLGCSKSQALGSFQRREHADAGRDLRHVDAHGDEQQGAAAQDAPPAPPPRSAAAAALPAAVAHPRRPPPHRPAARAPRRPP